MNLYSLATYVYCHTKDLKSLPQLKDKAIQFARERNMQIKGFCATDVYSAILLLSTEKINILLINNHSLTQLEHRLLMSYCRHNNISIVYFERI